MQTIITPGGETLVVLPLADYEALVDAAEVATADRVRADIAAGRDELVPEEVVTALLGGENPVRVWRRYRGLSAKALAEKAGLSAAYLSEIEAGKKDGSLSSLKALASALDIELDDIA